MRKENKHTLWILTLHSNSHQTAFLPSLIACCALVESGGGHGEILQQNPSRVVVVYTAQGMTVIPSVTGSAFIVYFIAST